MTHLIINTPHPIDFRKVKIMIIKRKGKTLPKKQPKTTLSRSLLSWRLSRSNWRKTLSVYSFSTEYLTGLVILNNASLGPTSDPVLPQQTQLTV